LVIILIPISYLILNKITEKKVIVIAPIKIESTQNHDNSLDSPDIILSNLKVAVALAEEEEILSEEEEANEVLKNLQNSIDLPVITETKTKATNIAKKVETLASKKKILSHKHVPKKHIAKKPLIKKHKAIKKKLVHKTKKQPKVKEKSIPKQHTITQENIITKKSIVQHQPVSQIVTPQRAVHRLSREEEVALYKQQHSQGLEVVGESKTFEIKDPTQSIPDEYYFKKHNPKVNQPVELNQFVKTLGVVKVSKQYEVKSQIPQKVELAKDGVVDISTASVETEELKKLDFVKPLEVTEVSEAFEASKAKKYLP